MFYDTLWGRLVDARTKERKAKTKTKARRPSTYQDEMLFPMQEPESAASLVLEIKPLTKLDLRELQEVLERNGGVTCTTDAWCIWERANSRVEPPTSYHLPPTPIS